MMQNYRGVSLVMRKFIKAAQAKWLRRDGRTCPDATRTGLCRPLADQDAFRNNALLTLPATET